MKPGTIQRLVETLDGAFTQLGVVIPFCTLEELAITVDRVMTGQGRTYHTPEHIFSLLDSANPIHCLAAPFHDIVYYQVDFGFAPEIEAVIAPYIQKKDDQLAITAQASPADDALALTLEVFGFAPGQKLSLATGLNEFLSALVMNKKLEDIVPLRFLMQATACIEATIPFRGKDADGKSSFDLLAARLEAINARRQLGMTTADIQDTVRSAVVFANKDVGEFASPDPATYLDGTWQLLPETNIALRSGTVYSVRDYRRAIQKAEQFIETLDPANVFHCYGGVPSPDEFEQMNARARANIATARDYLGIKLLTVAILEALAEISGGDAPLSLFMGDIERTAEQARCIEDTLPSIEAHPLVDVSSVIYRLLETGRAHKSSFDTQNAPLSLFVYKSLGPQRVQQLLANAKEMFEGKLQARQFLDKIEGVTIAAIARASAAMALTRSKQLREYAQTRAQDNATIISSDTMEVML